jgi:hypothetical protein
MSGGIELLLLSAGGAGASAFNWTNALGKPCFDRLVMEGVLEGPSGVSEARCFNCSEVGHPAPIVRTGGTYSLFCPEAGTVPVPRSGAEVYRVSRDHLHDRIAHAFGVADVRPEAKQFADDICFLGRARLGRKPFSLILAHPINSGGAFNDLVRRNREGFGQEKGIILVAGEIWGADLAGGFHTFATAESVIDVTADGFQPRWTKVRSLLGLPGRQRSEKTALSEATERFRALILLRRPLPAGQKGFLLFKQENPDLAHLSDATLYAAKQRARGA